MLPQYNNLENSQYSNNTGSIDQTQNAGANEQNMQTAAITSSKKMSHEQLKATMRHMTASNGDNGYTIDGAAICIANMPQSTEHQLTHFPAISW